MKKNNLKRLIILICCIVLLGNDILVFGADFTDGSEADKFTDGAERYNFKVERLSVTPNDAEVIHCDNWAEANKYVKELGETYKNPRNYSYEFSDEFTDGTIDGSDDFSDGSKSILRDIFTDGTGETGTPGLLKDGYFMEGDSGYVSYRKIPAKGSGSGKCTLRYKLPGYISQTCKVVFNYKYKKGKITKCTATPNITWGLLRYKVYYKQLEKHMANYYMVTYGNVGVYLDVHGYTFGVYFIVELTLGLWNKNYNK